MKKIEWPEKTKGLLLLLLLLFVTAAFLLKEEPAYTLTTEEAREPEALGAFDAEADGTGSEAAETVSLLTEEEQKQLQKEALEAAEYCRELYKDIRATEMESEGENNTFLLTREQQTAITARLGELGLVSAADNINMVNYEKVEEFYLDYLEDRETDVTIYEVNNDGSFCSETFIYRNKVLQTFTMTLTWEKGEQAEISNGTANNIAEIKYTSKGYLIYSYEYIVAHAALKEYYRVKPLSDTLRILTDQYVSVFNYLNYNFLTQNWDESNVETILLPRLFEDLYQVHTGEQLKKDSGRISAEIYENVMIACLPVTIEELRKHCGYDMESNTYDSGTFFYRGTSPFGEVVDYLDNSDGTLTLYVDAVWPDRNTDCAFKNEIVIKPYGDGTCQYLSNKVQKIELDIPVYEEY